MTTKTNAPGAVTPEGVENTSLQPDYNTRILIQAHYMAARSPLSPALTRAQILAQVQVEFDQRRSVTGLVWPGSLEACVHAGTFPITEGICVRAYEMCRQAAESKRGGI